MKTGKMLIFLTTVLLAGCIPSLHPLYTEKELVFEEGLLGSWCENETDKTNSWQFERAGEKAYKLIYTDSDGEKGPFEVHLVKLDDMLFLDLYPAEVEIKASKFYKMHLLPAHTFMKIEAMDPNLQMSMMDPEKMKKMLEADPNLLKHEIENNNPVLTASTAELQEFMKKHANDEGLFGDLSNMPHCRITEPNEPAAVDPNSVQ